MSFRFIVAFCLSVWVTNISFAQETINLVIDQSQSNVEISIPVLSGSDNSSISGTAVIELDSANPPFSTARLTELNMSMADGFTITHPIVVVQVPENGANVFFLEVGPTGNVNSESQFDQFDNLLGITGMAFVDDLLGAFDDVDLATVEPIPFDVDGATLSTDGNQLTMTTDLLIVVEFDISLGTATMILDGGLVMTGELPTKTIVGDINCDGVVNLIDVGPFVELLANGQFDPKADINGDQMLTLLDVQPFVDLLAGG